MEFKVTKTIQLPLELCKKVVEICEATGKSFSKIVEEAVEERVNKEEVITIHKD